MHISISISLSLFIKSSHAPPPTSTSSPPPPPNRFSARQIFPQTQLTLLAPHPSIFLNALCNSLRMLSPASPTPVSTAIFAGALHSSLASLGKYTPAQPGDRTLIDALHPFVTTLDRTADLDRAAQAATLAAQNTAGMPPRLGRSVYVGGSAWERVPDPGAVAVAALVRGLAEGLGRL